MKALKSRGIKVVRLWYSKAISSSPYRHRRTVNQNFHFISQIPLSVLGDQVVSQFLRCIPEKTWLYKYGRIPMTFLVHEQLWEVISSFPRVFPRIAFINDNNN